MVPSGSIKISGCPNGCGQHHVGSIGFQGSVRKLAGRAVPQYFVLVGGGCSDEGVAHFGKVVSKVPVHRLTDAVDRLLALYKATAAGAERSGRVLPPVPPALGNRGSEGSGAVAAERDHRNGFHRPRREPGVLARSDGRRVLGLESDHVSHRGTEARRGSTRRSACDLMGACPHPSAGRSRSS